MELGAVYFWSDDNLDTAVQVTEMFNATCAIAPIDGLTCFGSNFKYQTQTMGFMNSDGNFQAIIALCNVSDFTQIPQFIVCRYDALFYQSDQLYLITNAANDLFIPCSVESALTDYSCSVNASGPFVARYNASAILPLIYDWNASHTANISLPCVDNPNTSPALCSQVNITYASGATARIRIDASDIRLFLNETSRPLGCSIYDTATDAGMSIMDVAPPTPITANSSLLDVVDAYFGPALGPPPPRQAWNFTAMVERNVERVRQEQMRSTPAMASAKRSFQEALQFRKRSIICCLANTIRYGGLFIVAVAHEIVNTVRCIIPPLASLPLSYPPYPGAITPHASSRPERGVRSTDLQDRANEL